MNDIRGLFKALMSLRPIEWVPAAGLAVLQPLTTMQVVDQHLSLRGHPAVSRPLDGLALLLLTVAPLPLALRLRRPSAALLAVFLLTEVYLLAGYEPGPVWLGLLFAFVNCIIHGRRGATILVLAGGYGAGWLAASHPEYGLSTRIGVLAWLIILAAVGEIIRARQHFAAMERARESEAGRLQAESQRRRAGEERLRIAQDLHDVLAHHISLITVQAGVGLELFDRRPEQARAALAAVKESGSITLEELREALDILREPGSGLPRAPAPQLSHAQDVDALMNAARAAGLRVEFDDRRASATIAGAGQARVSGLPILVDQAAYRILQESLTNAIRHAGPGTLVLVSIEPGPADLVLTIRDDGRGATAGLPTGGRGLTGMRERTTALGGTFSAGPRPCGGYAIRAVIPLSHNSAHGADAAASSNE